MLFLICNNCKKNIVSKDLKSGNIYDMSKCPACGSAIVDAEKVDTTKREQNLENIEITELIRERRNIKSEETITLKELEEKYLKNYE